MNPRRRSHRRLTSQRQPRLTPGCPDESPGIILPVLAVVHVRFGVEWANPTWIEDELVRRGARDAHLVRDDVVAVMVEAKSQPDAQQLVYDLVRRAGGVVSAIGTGEQPLIGAPSQSA